MNTNRNMQKNWLLSLLLSTLVLSGCVTIQNTTPCHIVGRLTDGCDCAGSLNGHVYHLSMDQCLQVLEAQNSPYPDPDPNSSPGAMIQPHGSAIIESSSDYTLDKTARDTLCREAGNNCKYQVYPSPSPSSSYLTTSPR